VTLNWANDPYLLDEQPTPMNQWINANELLEQSRREEIFHKNGQLKLFPLMVRKNDFVRKKTSDRIIARLPFLVLEEDQKEFIQENILNLSEITRDYFYKSINKSIMDWKKVIENYLKKGVIPYPIYRCSFELDHTKSTHCNTKSLLHFTSARGETFAIPTKLTKKLAYLCGTCNGDGNLQKYALRIVDYSIKNIKQLQAMFEEYFAQTGNIQYKTENCPELVITNLWVVRLFSYLTDQPIGGKKYHALREPLIFQNDPIFRSYYWSGVMDSDGSYKNKSVVFASASLNYVEDFKLFLMENNIESKLTERDDNTVILYIPAKFHIQLYELLISLHPEKKLEFDILKSIPFRTAKRFTRYNDSSLINGFFNLRLMNKLSISGLGEVIHQFRNKSSRRIFAKQLNVNERTIQAIEEETMSISISLLDKILQLNDLKLMPFLTQQESIRYHIGNSKFVNLATQPSDFLAMLLTPLLFYNQSIKIPNKHHFLKKDLENTFKITIKNQKITSKILLNYFSTFCEVK